MDEFLDKYTNPDYKEPEPEKPPDFWDKMLKFLFKHPLITSILLIMPISFLIRPLGTIVFGILGGIMLLLFYVNAGILYLTGMMCRTRELSFSRFMRYSIPLTFLLLLLSPYGIIIPLSVFSVATFIILMFALDFEMGIFKTMMYTLMLYLINQGIIWGLIAAASQL